MGAVNKPKFVTAGVALTATGAIAASAVNGRELAVIDNSVNRYKQIDISASVVISDGAVAGASDSVNLFWYPVVLDASGNDIYPSGLTGGAADVTAVRTNDLRWLGAISPVVRNSTHKKPFTIHNPGVKWGLVVVPAITTNTADVTFVYNGINDEAV